jgi:hypothetical protein
MTIARIPLILLNTILITCAARAAEPSGSVQKQMHVHDLASQFVEVWDRNAAKSQAEFIQDFKSTIGSRFREFYSVERYGGEKTQAQRDQEIASAYVEFPALRDAYVQKTAQFTKDLPIHIANFKAVFPDYVPESDIYFVHSLGEMDGGTRQLGGRMYFIFGADLMVKAHGNGNEAPFFHHELFHDYHVMKCSQHQIWTSLWAEGLATYLAKTMNPSATNAELLLDLPPDMVRNTQKQLTRALDDLRVSMNREDPDAYSGLFMRKGDKTGLPARRGYYLGYLVAQEASKKYDVRQLAKLDCDAAREVVFSAVDGLRVRALIMEK